jgi:SUF system FeS cluster assembly, SufBD
VQEGARHSKSTVTFDALLVDTVSRSDTNPYVDVREDDVEMGHEASVSEISEDQLFYLMSRGMTEDETAAIIVRGFVEHIAHELPMEYALELNRLIELQMEGRSADDGPAGGLKSGAPHVQAARAAVLRPRGLPGAHRARGGVAVHAAAQCSEGNHIRPAAVTLRATRPAAHLVYGFLAVPAPGCSLRAPVVDRTVSMPPNASFAFPA